MQRKCSPQQCQSKLESSRNRYWEQEVNVSSWLRSSQQKLCRENKSSLTDSPSSTKTLVSCNSTCIPSRTRLHVCCFTTVRGAPEDHHCFVFFLFRNMKACEYFGVMMRSVSTIMRGGAWLHHKCQDRHSWQRQVRPEKLSKQKDQTKRHGAVSCGFPSSERWRMTDGRSFGGVSLCPAFRLAGAAGAVEAMMSIVEVVGVGQRSTWVLWPLQHSKKRFRGAFQPEQLHYRCHKCINQYVPLNLFPETGNHISGSGQAAHTTRWITN